MMTLLCMYITSIALWLYRFKKKDVQLVSGKLRKQNPFDE